MATNGNWNVRELRTHIDAMLFERSAIAKHPENIIAESLKSWVESQELDPVDIPPILAPEYPDRRNVDE